jgi:hypothetical protein
MWFNDDGTLRQGKDTKPLKKKHWTSAVYHHMVPWETLRPFWNKLVTAKHYHQMVRYLQLIDFPGHCQHIAAEVIAGRINELRDRDHDLYDDLATVLCWQDYNLFIGPKDRPDHAPDPTDMMVHFASVGMTTFDFPIVAPPHGMRANTLHRVFGTMNDYAITGGIFPIEQSLELLGSIAEEDIIPEHEVNWFALRKDRFWSMSAMQRLEFYQACMRVGRTADPEEEYERLFGSAL